jgi:hypothetical protein
MMRVVKGHTPNDVSGLVCLKFQLEISFFFFFAWFNDLSLVIFLFLSFLKIYHCMKQLDMKVNKIRYLPRQAST